MIALPLLTGLALNAPSQPPPEPAPLPVTFRPRGEEAIVLEGMLHLPGNGGEGPLPGIVFCHPDPRMGGAMDDAVVVACCRALLAEGVSVLRFNFRGVGESTGAFADGVGEVQDVLGALDFLRSRREMAGDHLFVGGYSFGAAMALRALPGAPELAGYVGVALPYSDEPGQREEYAFLPEVRTPLLIAIGAKDEYGDADAIRRLLEAAGGPTKVAVVPKAGHFLPFDPLALRQAAEKVAQFVRELAATEAEE